MGSTIESKTSIFKSIMKKFKCEKRYAQIKALQMQLYMDAYSDGIQVFTVFLKFKKTLKKKCRKPGSNQRPSDLQSDALPTELFRLLF